MLRKLTQIGVAAAAVAMALPATAAAEDVLGLPPESDHFTIVESENGVSVTLTAPPIHACNAAVVLKGTRAELSASEEALWEALSAPAWTGGFELLAHHPALLGTPRFGQGISEWLSPRTHVMDLPDGNYVIVGFCVPYDELGDYAGDDIDFSHAFTVGQPGGPIEPGEPTDPGEPSGPPSGGILGSLGPGFGS